MSKRQPIKLVKEFNEALIDFVASYEARGLNKATLSGGLIGIGNTYLVDSIIDTRLSAKSQLDCKTAEDFGQKFESIKRKGNKNWGKVNGKRF